MIQNYIALDLETTGLSPEADKIIEIGAVKFENGIEISRFETFVNPRVPIPERIYNITGINDDMVKDSPFIEDIIGDLLDYLGDSVLLGHNIIFDYKFIAQAARDNGMAYKAYGIDTFKVSIRSLPDIKGRSLADLCEYFSINTVHHRASADAISSAIAYRKMCEICDSDNDIKELIYKIKKQEKITDKQISFLKSLIARYGINYKKKIEDLTKSEASREIDNILSTYGIKR